MTAPAAPLEKAVEEARDIARRWDDENEFLDTAEAVNALRALLAALDADRGEAEARLKAILDYEPKEVCKDEFAYDRMVETYREVARRYFARREEKGENRG